EVSVLVLPDSERQERDPAGVDFDAPLRRGEPLDIADPLLLGLAELLLGEPLLERLGCPRLSLLFELVSHAPTDLREPVDDLLGEERRVRRIGRVLAEDRRDLGLGL